MKNRIWPKIFVLFFGLFVGLSIWVSVNTPNSIMHIGRDINNFNYSFKNLSSEDYRKLISLDNFQFLIFNNVCNKFVPFLLVLVHSAPLNVEKRSTIRQTWGQENVDLRLLFLVGNVSSKHLQLQLESENKKYQDLLQGNFVDNYRNMTFKHVMALKYAIYHCPKAKYVLKTDDDVFINTIPLLNYLKKDSLLSFLKNSILCPLYFPTGRVKRTYRSKWRVSFTEYSNRYYPPYCSGFSIVYSPDVLFTLYVEAQRTQYFWIDDAHITGVLAYKAKLTHFPLHQMVLSKTIIENIKNYGNCSDCSNKNYLFAESELSTLEIRSLWSFMSQLGNMAK